MSLVDSVPSRSTSPAPVPAALPCILLFPIIQAALLHLLAATCMKLMLFLSTSVTSNYFIPAVLDSLHSHSLLAANCCVPSEHWWSWDSSAPTLAGVICNLKCLSLGAKDFGVDGSLVQGKTL